MSARFVSVSGIDGSGKSTQVAAVSRALAERGLPVHTCKTQLSATYSIFDLAAARYGDSYGYHPHIPATLREFVVASDVVRHWKSTIEPSLCEGRTVIWDRGPLCYETYARTYGADMTWVLPMLRLVPQPDVTFLLDVDPAMAWDRICLRTEKPVQTSEHPDFLKLCREQYLVSAADFDNVVVLDGSGEAEDLTAEIVDRIMDTSPVRRRASLR